MNKWLHISSLFKQWCMDLIT